MILSVFHSAAALPRCVFCAFSRLFISFQKIRPLRGFLLRIKFIRAKG